MSKWISVEERLPDEKTTVAAWAAFFVDLDSDFGGTDLANEYYYFFAHWRLIDGKKAWFEYRGIETYHDGTLANLDVTHWMPLPEGPK